MAEAGAAAAEEQADISVSVKWSGRVLNVSLPPASTLGALKRKLEDETAVPSSRLKLLGMKPLAPADDALLSSLVFAKTGLMMMGAPDSVLAAQQVRDGGSSSPRRCLRKTAPATRGSVCARQLPLSRGGVCARRSRVAHSGD